MRRQFFSATEPSVYLTEIRAASTLQFFFRVPGAKI